MIWDTEIMEGKGGTWLSIPLAEPAVEPSAHLHQSLTDSSYPRHRTSDTCQTENSLSVRDANIWNMACVFWATVPARVWVCIVHRSGFCLKGMLNSYVILSSPLSTGSHRTGFLDALKESPARYPFHIVSLLLCAYVRVQLWDHMCMCHVSASDLVCVVHSLTPLFSAHSCSHSSVKDTVSMVWHRWVLTDLTRLFQPMGQKSFGLEREYSSNVFLDPALTRCLALQVFHSFRQAYTTQ